MTRDFFLYTISNDLAASRRFYTDLLGLEKIWDEPEALAYALGSAVQLSIGLDGDAEPASEWAFQPDWAYGLGVDPLPRHAVASWSIALDPQAFTAVVGRLQSAGVPALRPEPFWVGYWSYVVRDPMGYTVELSDPVTVQAT